MLTDIFAERYAERGIWKQYTEIESRLLMQCYRIVAEQIMPPWWVNGKESKTAKAKWTSVSNRLTMELGIDELGPRYYSYPMPLAGTTQTMTGTYSLDDVCKTWMTLRPQPLIDHDRFIKERMSFVELSFRLQEEELASMRAELAAKIAAAEIEDAAPLRPFQIPGSRADWIRESQQRLDDSFVASVAELNERLRRAGAPLNYHNGFIQIAGDALVEAQIEKPFWSTVAAPPWKNVDIDMKEALDRRDSSGRDPAFYGARALESVVKIISDQKGWTHGGEKGASGYIDNLGSSKNGFIESWEREALKAFFKEVRNPLGHGPGGQEMPELTPQQTDWAIETCMSWTKTLIARM